MLLAAEDARVGTVLPVHVVLEAVVGRGEDDCVVNLKVSLTGELAPRLDEADALGPPLELHLVLVALTHVQGHLHRRAIVLQLVLLDQELLHVGRHSEVTEVLTLQLNEERRQLLPGTVA
jgi:hypothetical protein